MTRVSPDGWVVLPVDEYRALRERANPHPPVTVTATLPGFGTARSSFNADERPRRLEIAMALSGRLEETITVAAEAPRVDAQRAVAAPPSQNVIDLQRKATGVLPVRIDVPRAGTSHQFVRPLVVDQETVVRLRYKRR